MKSWEDETRSLVLLAGESRQRAREVHGAAGPACVLRGVEAEQGKRRARGGLIRCFFCQRGVIRKKSRSVVGHVRGQCQPLLSLTTLFRGLSIVEEETDLFRAVAWHAAEEDHSLGCSRSDT